MGWYFGYETKAELIREVTRESRNEKTRHTVLAKAVRGNNLWTVMEIEDFTTGKMFRIIVLFLIQGGAGDWGYKDISEDMGPLEVNCPLSYLDMASPSSEIKGCSKDWRDKVRSHHARFSGLKSGAYMVPLAFTELGVFRIESVRPFRGVHLSTGQRFQLRRDVIHSVHATREEADVALAARS